MNRRLLLQMTAPSVIIGTVLLGACLASIWSINRLQRNLAQILSVNVTSVEASQELEIQLRQLRFHTVLNFADPKPERQALVERDERNFESALARARLVATQDQQRELIDAIQTAYQRYQAELRKDHPEGTLSLAEFIRWADGHSVSPLQPPCRELHQFSKNAMFQTALESETVSHEVRFAMLLAGLLGPFSGLIIGFGLARGLSRSIARLNVRLQDVHAELDQDVGSIRLDPGGDLRALDQQLDRVLVRVREVAETVQRQERDMLRSEQLAAVGQLAASVAHEVRNPLTSIKMLVGGALRTHGSQALSDDDLRVIYDEIGRLETTAQNLLDFARPSALQREPTDLVELIQQSVDLIRPRAQQQNVALILQLPDVPVIASVDRHRLHGVFLNLLLNALDALPLGGRVEITLVTGPEVRITVADSGPGIAPHIAERLFTPFASSKATGTGLGLSICRRVLEDHGGSINAQNRPGGGAEFNLVLPRPVEEDRDAALAGRR